MTRSILIYAGLLAVLVLGIQWLEYQYMARSFTAEIYIVLIALGFAALGIWLGRVFTPQPKAEAFSLNQAALETLGITKREYAVLERLADGHSNKQIADLLHVSPNTVKTHIAKLYEKLDVNQRLQAVQKAKDLQLIP